MKLRSVAVAATGLALAGTTLAGTAHAAPSDQLTLRVTQTPVTRADADAVPNGSCTPGLTRTHECQMISTGAVVLVNGRPVGEVRFIVTHEMTLQIKSRKWSENVSVGKATIIGSAGGISVGIRVSCGGPCSAANHIPQGRTLGAPFSGKVDYTDNIGAFKSHGTATKYEYTFFKPGYIQGSNSYSSASYRCDDMFAKKPGKKKPRQSPGCVFPQVTPTLTDMAALPNIGPGIRAIQSRGGHYGRPGSGHPLHFLADETKQDANRRAVCRGLKPPVGAAGPSCDEYPFAATHEGGTALPPASRGITWVPVRENNRQGGILNKFQLQQRILDRDGFWVQV
ncbi:hypothetical protein VR41_10370 [Streptomyces sp. NRRL B-1568]|nr:hypothetical protein VR41_10370 [Streptomyces sp. NRRL B-1568]